jgi:hypothetical protein
MPDLVHRLALLEEVVVNHEVRLLLLIDAFSRGENAEGVRGLTKLAKLDFLLRYPTFLERALMARVRSTRTVRVQDFERRSVEARMVRYRFGPWDHRYPEVLRRLEARGLVQIEREGRTIIVKTTEAGGAVANQLGADTTFEDVAARASTLRTHMNLTATNLMRFIYETFPEVISLRSNEEIKG